MLSFFGYTAIKVSQLKAFRESLYWDEEMQVHTRQYLNNQKDYLFTRPAGLIILDMDGLKKVNDTEGHLAGDAMIKGFIKSVRENIRQDDTLVRIGGDEFVLIVPMDTLINIRTLLTRLQTSVPFSFGISEKTKTKPYAKAFEEADSNMYQQKQLRKAAQGALDNPLISRRGM